MKPTSHLHSAANEPRVITPGTLASSDYAAVHLIDGDGGLPVVASCPHAGRDYPASMLDAAQCDIGALRGLEDFGVNYLLPDFINRGIACVMSNLARAYLDVNRPTDALDPDMFTHPPDNPINFARPSRFVQAGYGIIPRMTAGRQPIYKNRLPSAVINERIAALHTPYHHLLQSQLDATSTAHGRALLIDFHSMPKHDRSQKTLPDIVLGDCQGTTLDKDIGTAIAHLFENKNLSVAWNHPYAGGFITRNNGRIGTSRQSLQIEINRGLYMKDDTPDGPLMIPEKTRHIAAIMGQFADHLGQLHSDGTLTFG